MSWRIVLTGASGFIGDHLLQTLIKDELEVIVPVRNFKKFNDQDKLANVKILPGLFYDDAVLENISAFKPEAIIHLSAIRGEGKGNWEDYFRVNVNGSAKLCDFALQSNVKLFVYISTVGVYGTIPRELPANIHTQLIPDNLYHQSKYEAERLVIKKLNGKIPYIILRPTITYGPGDNGFLMKLIDLVKMKKFPLTRKDIKIHLLNVQTICEFVSLLLQRKNSENVIINLADRQPVSLASLVNLIHSHFHGVPYPTYLKVPAWFYSAGKKIADFLQWKKLKTSIQLISESWYYDNSQLYNQFVITQFDTLTSIRDLLKNEYPGKSRA